MCEREGIGQIVWSPLAQGILSGKYTPDRPIPEGSRAASTAGSPFFDKLVGQWLQKEVLQVIERIKPLAQEAGLTLPQLAVAWVLQNQHVSSAIIGASNPEQIKENVKAAGVKLDTQIMQQINHLLAGVAEFDPKKTG